MKSGTLSISAVILSKLTEIVKFSRWPVFSAMLTNERIFNLFCQSKIVTITFLQLPQLDPNGRGVNVVPIKLVASADKYPRLILTHNVLCQKLEPQ